MLGLDHTGLHLKTDIISDKDLSILNDNSKSGTNVFAPVSMFS